MTQEMWQIRPDEPSPPPGPGVPRSRLTLWPVFVAVAVLAVLGAAATVVWRVTARPGDAASSTVAASPTGDAATGRVVADGPSVAASRAVAEVDPSLLAVDDFAGDVPETSRWGIYESTAPNGGRWARSQVSVADGELRVVGTGRDPTGNGNLSGGLCWCGAGGDRTYGKWQVRARFDAGAGYGQVVGLWPQSDKGADGNMVFATAREPHKRTLRGFVIGQPKVERTVAGDFSAWHVYTIEWRATYVKMWVDDQLYLETTTSPAVPLHLYMQQTVGPSDGVPAADASTPDRVVMRFDWVKMYR